MQLEINVTQFVCIPVGDIPRMQLMTHSTRGKQKDRQRVGCYKMISAIRGHSPYFITR